MERLKLALSKITTGFFYGLGFFIVVAVFYGGVFFYFNEKQDEYSINETGDSDCRSFKKCEKGSGLAVKIITERVSSEQFVLLGEVSNNGDIDWTSVNLKAELFDENDNFIEMCTHYIDELVSPQSKVNFKLSCSNCSKLELANYASYKIKITNANAY